MSRAGTPARRAAIATYDPGVRDLVVARRCARRRGRRRSPRPRSSRRRPAGRAARGRRPRRAPSRGRPRSGVRRAPRPPRSSWAADSSLGTTTAASPSGRAATSSANHGVLGGLTRTHTGTDAGQVARPPRRSRRGPSALRRRRHRILEVEHDDVGRRAGRLGGQVGPVARDEQHAAPAPAVGASCRAAAHQRRSAAAGHQLVALVERPVLEHDDALRRPRRRRPGRDDLGLGADRVAVEDRRRERDLLEPEVGDGRAVAWSRTPRGR